MATKANLRLSQSFPSWGSPDILSWEKIWKGGAEKTTKALTEEARHTSQARKQTAGHLGKSRVPCPRPGTGSLTYGLLSYEASGAPTRYYQGVAGWPCTDGLSAPAEFPGAL